MPDQIERTLRSLSGQLPGRVFRPCEEGYAVATAIWAKPVGSMPRAIVHCRTPEDVQLAIQTARDCGLPLSVRGGGHHWAGRALCAGIVIDLSGMNGVSVDPDHRSAIISGGARAADVAAVTDPLHVAAATGTCSAAGMAGLTLGGGYGPLIGRFGLALDNLLAAQIVLADGRIIVASRDNEAELFWALRGGGGNFGVVTAMRFRLHRLPSVRTGLLVYPFSDAKAVLRRCADIAASSPEDLTVEFACTGGPDGRPVVIVHPTWCGPLAEGEARVAPFLKLGTLLAGNLEGMSYGTSLTLYDPYIVNGQRVFMDTCWLRIWWPQPISVLVAFIASVAASRRCNSAS
jgi:FAD/FMN-containing dehydrogenase